MMVGRSASAGAGTYTRACGVRTGAQKQVLRWHQFNGVGSLEPPEADRQPLERNNIFNCKQINTGYLGSAGNGDRGQIKPNL